VCVPRLVGLWLVIDPCVICLWTCVLCSFVYNFYFPQFSFVLETPDDG
jgi:hypothetical protein